MHLLPTTEASSVVGRLSWGSILGGATVACAILFFLAHVCLGLGWRPLISDDTGLHWSPSSMVMWSMCVSAAFAAGAWFTSHFSPVKTQAAAVRIGLVVWAVSALASVAICLPLFVGCVIAEIIVNPHDSINLPVNKNQISQQLTLRYEDPFALNPQTPQPDSTSSRTSAANDVVFSAGAVLPTTKAQSKSKIDKPHSPASVSHWKHAQDMLRIGIDVMYQLMGWGALSLGISAIVVVVVSAVANSKIQQAQGSNQPIN